MTHRVLKSYRSNIYVIDIYAIMKTIMKKMLSFQVHELLQTHCGDKREQGTLFS